MGDEHLDTIPATESDEFIKSYVENLVPNPSESEEEIDLSFNPDDPMPSGIEDDDYDSGRDIPTLKELLDNYSISLPTNESYHFDIPSPYRPSAKPPDGNTKNLNIKMLGDIYDQKLKKWRLAKLRGTLKPCMRRKKNKKVRMEEMDEMKMEKIEEMRMEKTEEMEKMGIMA
nr:hypothetical protein [Tanacetum cinerariifolium]